MPKSKDIWSAIIAAIEKQEEAERVYFYENSHLIPEHEQLTTLDYIASAPKIDNIDIGFDYTELADVSKEQRYLFLHAYITRVGFLWDRSNIVGLLEKNKALYKNEIFKDYKYPEPIKRKLIIFMVEALNFSHGDHEILISHGIPTERATLIDAAYHSMTNKDAKEVDFIERFNHEDFTTFLTKFIMIQSTLETENHNALYLLRLFKSLQQIDESFTLDIKSRGLFLKPREYAIFCDGKKITLPPQETEILKILANSYPSTVSNEELYKIWSSMDVKDPYHPDNLKQSLYVIRTACISAFGKEQGKSLIETVRNKGKRLTKRIPII